MIFNKTANGHRNIKISKNGKNKLDNNYCYTVDVEFNTG